MGKLPEKHLELIQSVITRMASNSFAIGGWSVTLVSALFALAAANHDQNFVVLAYFPMLSFWVLDGYYLHQERLFRSLYDDVRKKEESDFSMATGGTSFGGWASALASKPIVAFHAVLLLSILVAWSTLLGS